MSVDPGQEFSNNGLDYTVYHSDTYPFIDPTKSDLNGKYVLVTGASKGIGKAMAVSFAQAGASGIAIGARSSLIEIEKEVKAAAQKANRAEPQVVSVALDVADRKSVESAAAQVSEAFRDRLDILVNNAGYLSCFKKIADTDPDEWWKDWQVNILGAYLVTRSFIPLLRSGVLKTIVNVSSVGAHFVSPGASSYQSGKFALIRFSEFANIDHEEDGILCYSIHPGAVVTDLALKMPETYTVRLKDKSVLAGDTVVWLTRERREWLAGRYVSVNWDMKEILEKKDEIIKGDLLKVRMAINTFPSQ